MVRLQLTEAVQCHDRNHAHQLAIKSEQPECRPGCCEGCGGSCIKDWPATWQAICKAGREGTKPAFDNRRIKYH